MEGFETMSLEDDFLTPQDRDLAAHPTNIPHAMREAPLRRLSGPLEQQEMQNRDSLTFGQPDAGICPKTPRNCPLVTFVLW